MVQQPWRWEMFPISLSLSMSRRMNDELGSLTKRPQILPLPVCREKPPAHYFLAQVRAPIRRPVTVCYGTTHSVGLDNTGKIYPFYTWNLHIWDPKWSLHMEPSPIPVLTDSSREGLAPDAPLHSATEGTERNTTGSTVRTLWSSFWQVDLKPEPLSVSTRLR